jgi:WD40 repeat protein
VIHSIDSIRGAVVFSVDFSPDNSMVACGTSDGWAQVFSVADGELLHELNNSSVDVSCVVFSPNGKQLATSSGEGITIWDISVSEQDEREDQSDRVIRFFEGHTEPVTCLVFSPDGSKVASSSLDGTARLWSINEKEGPIVLDAQYELTSVCYLPQPPSVEFEFVAVGCADRTIRIFNATESVCVLAIEGHEAAVSTVCTSIDGGYLFSFSESNKLCKIWQLTFTGDEITCTCRATMTLSGTSITAMSLVSVPGSSAAEWLAGWDGDAMSFALDDDSLIGGITIGSNDENTLSSTKSATFTNKQLEYVLTFGDITGCINVFRSVLSF